MSADTRSVSTDALATLGTILDDKQKRDAIHLAVMPVVAGERLIPGGDVGLNKDDGTADGYSLPLLGIVDPFLKNAVKRGERFWLVIYPRVISSLRHVWSHPGIADEAGAVVAKGDAKSADRLWLEDYAESIDTTYNSLMEGTREFLDNGEYFNEGPKFEGITLPYKFWEHYDAVTGRTTSEDKRHSFFSCAC